MLACLGNTATPHVLLLKKCHTRWYTASRTQPGQRSEELGPAGQKQAELTYVQVHEHESKDPQLPATFPRTPRQRNEVFSLHAQLEALRFRRANNTFEILGSILSPKWEGSRLPLRRIFFPRIIPTAGSAPLRAAVLPLRCPTW